MGNFAENLNLGNRFRPPWFSWGGGGKARFNVATPTNATVTCRPTAYVCCVESIQLSNLSSF